MRDILSIIGNAVRIYGILVLTFGLIKLEGCRADVGDNISLPRFPSKFSEICEDVQMECDPADKRHLFYEEMKRLFYNMREIEPEDLDDESLDQFMAAADQLSNTIHAIEMRRRREKTAQKLRT